MKKSAVFFLCLIFCCHFIGGIRAQSTGSMFRPGSLLVYPLIDNINYQTIVEINNLGLSSVWLQGYVILHPPGAPHDFEKKNFVIHLTPREPFWWNTSRAYSRRDADGVLTQIQAFNRLKGFMYVWAVNIDKGKREIAWNHLKGDAVVFNSTIGRSFQYHAIPHQALTVSGDRVLNLNGKEYSMPGTPVLVEGFAENYVPGLDGTWVVCSLGDDFTRSDPPQYDINLSIWNQDEIYQSRHVDFYQFEQYDLKDDLQIDINNIFTPKWRFSATANGPIWSIFYQTAGGFAWGGNVGWNPDEGIPVTVTLPPVSEAHESE